MASIVTTRAGRGTEFLERLRETILVADGAMGTMLYARGVFINQSFDALCLTRPELVREVHAEYVDAGAQLLETNTFGANRARLAGHGLEDRVREINLAAVRIARDVAGDRAFVGGSIGPVGVAGQVAGHYTPADLREIFAEQAEALLEAGVDVLVVETIPGLVEMEAALAAIRGLASDAPVIAMMTFGDENETQSGETPEEVVAHLGAAGADVVGANCSVGPRPMLDLLARMAGGDHPPLAAMPNAGLPQSVEGRLLYMASPEYFGKYAKRFVKAGVRLLGGCCGTTPEHVRAMTREVAGFSPRREPSVAITVDPVEAPSRITAAPTAEKTVLARKLSAGAGFVTSVELTPPKSADLDALLADVRALAAVGIDAVNIPEYARISPRPTPLAIARAIQDDVDIETIIHYCCRDRNLYGMQADLLSAHALGVRNVLVITGDPPKAGGYAVPTAVFDVDSIGLVKVAAGLNRGVDAAGRDTGVPLGLHLGVGVNPGATDLALELDRFRRKVEAAAEFAMTQPVFDARLLERFLVELGEAPVPILVGILPLYSYRNAEFLHNEVPGMHVPAPIRERMRRAVGKEGAHREGVAIAREALAGVRGLAGVAGAYLMPPFGRYELALEVLEGTV
jgi:methionine synthase I (cobalamin-dependent)/5,10-methylenetetrahydrofolate reductase